MANTTPRPRRIPELRPHEDRPHFVKVEVTPFLDDMPKSDDSLLTQIRSNNLAGLKTALKADPASARSPRVIVEAGRLGLQPVLAALVRAGADINAVYRGYGAIHALIQEEAPEAGSPAPKARLACLEWMLANGANAELPGAFPPARALLVAAFAGIKEYCDALVDAGCIRDGFTAAAMGDLRAIVRRIKQDPSFAKTRDVGGLTALQCCAASRVAPANKLRDIGRLLLDHGADPNAKTKSYGCEVDAIHFAATKTNGVFELLLNRGADPNSGLTASVWNKRYDLAVIATAHGAKPDLCFYEGKPLLNQLIRWGQIEQALWLLDRGASPNISDDRGWTAVHQAASRGNEKILRAVLASGGDIKKKTMDGETPSGVAESNSQPKMYALLS